MSNSAAVFAAASGVVHLAVVRHHLEYGVITGAFLLMGTSQLLVAVGLLSRPLRRMRLAAVLLHTGILATWLLSRTVGLVVVRGAEDPASFGYADTVANLLAVGAIGSLAVIERLDHRTVPARAARGVIAAIAVLAFSSAVPAAVAPHAHAGRDHPATSEPGAEHDEAPAVDGHDDHVHAHG